MGIPRKGSRTVEAGGKRYVFLVKQTAIPDHPDQKSLRLVVQEEAERPGRVLRAHFFFETPITPAFVEALIQEGSSLGWNPSDRGAAFDLPPDRSQGRYCESDPRSYR